jgi:hypothetical protein
MKTRVAILFLMALPLYAADEMRKLDFMVGEWRGEASMQQGPGKPAVALQHEMVRSKLGGKLLLIEGTGHRKLETGFPGDVVHDAVGVLSFDEKTQKYRFDAWTERAGYVQAWFEVGEKNNARWGFDTPEGGKIRYTITLTEQGTWHEAGEFSRDGNQWMPFFEMNLKKVK